MATCVDRRRFIVTLGGAAAWPLAARAQKVPTVGFLTAASPSTHQPFTGAFRAGLREAGYIDAQNATIEVRLADGHYDRMPGLIRELLDRQVQALACGSGAGVLAKAETSTVPIVALSAGDPVRSGLVSSFNRPGGNVTAIALYAFSLGAKRFQLLHEVVPYARIIAVLVNPVQPDPESKADLKDVEAEAETLNQRIEVVRAASELDFNEAFAKMVDMGAGALLVMADPLFSNWRIELVTLTAKHRLPAIFAADGAAAAGGLMSYGSSIQDGFRHMGIYVAKIFDGVRPGDLPVEQAVKVELALNLKTAKTLGLTFPISLLGSADEVNE